METTNCGFNIGDRVSVAVACPDGNEDLDVGVTGTVLVIDYRRGSDYPPFIGIEWDIPIENGHTLDGCAQKGYGWWVEPDDILLESKEVDYDMPAASDEELTSLLCF